MRTSKGREGCHQTGGRIDELSRESGVEELPIGSFVTGARA